jgi:hypothetical protein
MLKNPSARSIAARLPRWAPYMALGPVSGPLTAGVVLNIRDGRPVLASLYGLLLTLWLSEATLWAAQTLPASLSRLF